MPSELHLVVPGLCGPFPQTVELYEHTALSQLADCLVDTVDQPAEKCFYDQLANLFQLPSPLPAASLSMLACDQGYAGYCIQAAPVHLKADMDHVILYGEYVLQLDRAEKNQLLHELNQHFAQDGIELSEYGSAWFIKTDQAKTITTTALHDAIGRNVNFFLPQGENESFWKRFLNEAQMLMHMSVVNQQREQHGQLVANGLWIWGEGAIANIYSSHNFDAVISDERLLQGIAKQGDCEYAPMSELGTQLQNSKNSQGKILVCDTRLQSAVSYADYERWLQALKLVIDDLIIPVLRQAQSEKQKLVLYPCAGKKYILQGASWCKKVTRLFSYKRKAEDYICRDD